MKPITLGKLQVGLAEYYGQLQKGKFDKLVIEVRTNPELSITIRNKRSKSPLLRGSFEGLDPASVVNTVYEVIGGTSKPALESLQMRGYWTLEITR